MSAIRFEIWIEFCLKANTVHQNSLWVSKWNHGLEPNQTNRYTVGLKARVRRSQSAAVLGYRYTHRVPSTSNIKQCFNQKVRDNNTFCSALCPSNHLLEIVIFLSIIVFLQDHFPMIQNGNKAQYNPTSRCAGPIYTMVSSLHVTPIMFTSVMLHLSRQPQCQPSPHLNVWIIMCMFCLTIVW